MKHKKRFSAVATVAAIAIVAVACEPEPPGAEQGQGQSAEEGQIQSVETVTTNASASGAAAIAGVPGGQPLLDGIWQALVPANWDIRPHAAGAATVDALGASGAAPPGLGIVVGGEIPYQEWAREQQARNFADRQDLDPEANCFMPGVPRATYLPHPFQILQTDDVVMIAYQYANAVRTVHMTDPGPAPTSFWMGWSVGRWEGDTLVVEVTNQKPDTWLDRVGNFHSEALRVTERYTPMGPNHIRYEATLEDPNVFTEPWTISLPLYRRVEENAQLLEFKCVPFAEEKIYGHLRKGATGNGAAVAAGDR